MRSEYLMIYAIAAAVLAWLLYQTVKELRIARRWMRRMTSQWSEMIKDLKLAAQLSQDLARSIQAAASTQAAAVEDLRRSVDDFSRQLFASGGDYTPYSERTASVTGDVNTLVSAGLDERLARQIAEEAREPML